LALIPVLKRTGIAEVVCAGGMFVGLVLAR
jgi:hypothetical protein